MNAPRTIRLLQQAEGWLEIGVPARTLSVVASIAPAEIGNFAPAVALLRGEANIAQGRHDVALEDLAFAAARIPAPMNRRPLSALATCFRAMGDESRAATIEEALNAESDDATEPPRASDRFYDEDEDDDVDYA